MLLMPPDPNAKPLDEGTLSVETEMADQNWPGKAKCPPRVDNPRTEERKRVGAMLSRIPRSPQKRKWCPGLLARQRKAQIRRCCPDLPKNPCSGRP